MKLKIALIWVTLLSLFVCSSSVRAQSIEELQRQIERAEKEIAANTNLLNSVKKERDLSMNELKLVRSRINSRRVIVRSLEKQASLINIDIDKKNRAVARLNSEIEELKSEYAEMIVMAYKNYKLNNYLLFLFSSKDFNDATKRIAYMKRYNKMRESKAEQIEKLRVQSEIEIKELNNRHIELSKTKTARERELAVLGKEESQYEGEVKVHQSKESSINAKIRQQTLERANAQRQIQEIIASEQRKNRRENSTMSETEQRYVVELSGRFDQNIGKLPYPITGGVIVDRFGVHGHPTIKGLTVNNKGVNIAGKRGSPVHSVFDGVVSIVLFIPGLNNCVMVRHGSYITVYSNLATVSVKTGDKIKFDQVLGTLSDSAESDDWTLHFEIWKETTALNPENCLKR